MTSLIRPFIHSLIQSDDAITGMCWFIHLIKIKKRVLYRCESEIWATDLLLFDESSQTKQNDIKNEERACYSPKTQLCTNFKLLRIYLNIFFSCYFFIFGSFALPEFHNHLTDYSAQNFRFSC